MKRRDVYYIEARVKEEENEGPTGLTGRVFIDLTIDDDDDDDEGGRVHGPEPRMRGRSESELASESDEEEWLLEKLSNTEKSASDEDEDEEGDDSYCDSLMNRERSNTISYTKSCQNADRSLDQVQGMYTSSADYG